jgi:peptidoglycan/LPS O-acetylase OafA/YrhL
MRPSGAVFLNFCMADLMTQRTRKFVGTIALILIIILYALLAMAVAIVLQVNDASKMAELAYYVIAGLLWVIPAGLLITWMQKSDR